MQHRGLSAAARPTRTRARGHLALRVALTGVGCVLTATVLLMIAVLRPGATARGAQGANPLRQIVLALYQYEVGAFRELIPPVVWDDGTVYRRGLCFDKPALDVETGRKVGEATECFLEVREEDGGMALRNVSFLSLPGGRIVARHRTTLQPVLDPNSPATHVVGALPSPEESNVIETSGRFRGTTGQARIVGLVDLELFRMDDESGIKFFEWIYLIQLSRPGR